MAFYFDRNSWHAFQGGLSMQVAPPTSVKGLVCDPTDAVKSGLPVNWLPVRCAKDSESHLTGSQFRPDLTASVGPGHSEQTVRRVRNMGASVKAAS